MTHYAEFTTEVDPQEGKKKPKKVLESEEDKDEKTEQEGVGLSQTAEKLLATYMKQFEDAQKPRYIPGTLTESFFEQLKDVYDIEYTNGDQYRGELAGEKRHGIGMFTYGHSKESVIGEFKDDFMQQGEVRHPNYQNMDVLVPLSLMKFDNRTAQHNESAA
jgi:hypothetical protein